VTRSGWPPWQWLAWLPNGRWLFVIDAKGHLDAVKARTGRVTDLTEKFDTRLPGVRELAVRGRR
jgi:hypothetical protein